jgi:hypothetical protein
MLGISISPSSSSSHLNLSIVARNTTNWKIKKLKQMTIPSLWELATPSNASPMP